MFKLLSVFGAIGGHGILYAPNLYDPSTNANIEIAGATSELTASSSIYQIPTRLRPEVEDMINMIEPASTPLLSYFNMLSGSEKIGNPIYHVQEEWPLRNRGIVTTGANTSQTTTMVLDDVGFIIPFHVLINQRTQEMMVVTAVDRTTKIPTITRGVGGTSTATINVGDEIIATSTAAPEAHDPVQITMRGTDMHENYAQKIHHVMSISDIMNLHAVYGPNERDRINTQGMLEFKKKQNRALMLHPGGSKATDASGLPQYITAGLWYYCNLYNAINMGGAVSYQSISFALQSIIRYGGAGRKTIFVGAKVWSIISSVLPRTTLMTSTQDTTTLGFTVKTIEFPGGQADLVLDYTLEGPGYDDVALVADMQYLGLNEFEPMTTEPINTLGAGRQNWQIYRRLGLKCKLPIAFGRLYNIKYAA